MRKSAPGILSRFGGLALLLLLAPASPLTAQQQNPLRIPDPTPRKTDPALIYGPKNTADNHARVGDAGREDQRRALITWGANELVKLSQELNAEVAKQSARTPRQPLAAHAEKIETLARNLKLAVKAQ